MNLFVWVCLHGTKEQLVEAATERWHWITPRGAVVARARILEICEINDLHDIVDISMRPIRAWVSGAIRIFITVRCNDGTERSTEMRIDNDLDPNFYLNKIIYQNNWQQYYNGVLF